MKAVGENNLDLIGTVPEDHLVQDFDLKGRPTVELGKDSKALLAAYKIFEKLFPN